VPKTSKPGIPYVCLGSCNRDIIENDWRLIVDAVVERITLLCAADPEQLKELTPQQLVQAGYCDPVRMFIKKEPHSVRKYLSKRWRLIFAISLVDQIVERLLGHEQNSKEIREWMDNPSAPGISLSSDSALEEFYHRVANEADGQPLAEADITGWDWSVKEWELLWEAESRIKLGSFTPSAASALRNRFLCISRAVYAAPDGNLFTLIGNGVMLSGCYFTSSSNSRIRVLTAFMAGASWAIAMGDDCVEEYRPDASEKYEALGHPLKMYQERKCLDGAYSFEFCSQLFSEDGTWPVDGTKTLYRLLEQKTISPELKQQFYFEMRNHPRLSEFKGVVREVEQSFEKNRAQDDAKQSP
jgi:hypothetical protein